MALSSGIQRGYVGEILAARRAQILNCTAKKTVDEFFETYRARRRACCLTLRNSLEWLLLRDWTFD